MGFQTQPGEGLDSVSSAIYFVDEHGIDALGVELIAGENFSASDISWRGDDNNDWPAKLIVSQALASKLFGDANSALGKTVFINNTEPMTITGVLKTLQSPWNGWGDTEHAALVPQQLESKSSRIFVRTAPGRRDELMPQIEKMLADSDKQRIIRNVKTMADTRAESYREASATNQILLTVIVVLTLITAFGIVGLAMFSINRRTRQIGTRRALGATRAQIIRYFMLENLLISTAGVALGVVGAIGLNIWLVATYSLSPIGPGLIVTGVFALLVVGQLAVGYPALQASRISPATATRGRA